MDPITIEKLQAMNKYKKNQFLNHFILYSFTALTCSLFCSSPFWLPSLCSSMKVFLSVSLPTITAFVFNPKFLFIVCNIIVIFLVGESKLVGSKSSPATEIYEEYVNRSGSLRKLPSVEEKKEKEEIKLELTSVIEESVKRVVDEEDKEKVMEEKGGGVEEEEADEEKEREEELDDEEEELGLPAEELNRRVEDFIARVNKQMKREAGLLVSCSA